MKIIKTLLVSTLFISGSAYAMQKESKRTSEAKSSSSTKTRRSERFPERPRRSSTSNPELAKLINVVLTLQKQNESLLIVQKATHEKLIKLEESQSALSAAVKSAQKTVEDQKIQICQLCTILKSTEADLLPVALLDGNSDLDEELETRTFEKMPLVSEFVPETTRNWQNSRDKLVGPKPDTSSHLTQVFDSSITPNPWPTPNYAKK